MYGVHIYIYIHMADIYIYIYIYIYVCGMYITIMIIIIIIIIIIAVTISVMIINNNDKSIADFRRSPKSSGALPFSSLVEFHGRWSRFPGFFFPIKALTAIHEACLSSVSGVPCCSGFAQLPTLNSDVIWSGVLGCVTL